MVLLHLRESVWVHFHFAELASLFLVDDGIVVGDEGLGFVAGVVFFVAFYIFIYLLQKLLNNQVLILVRQNRFMILFVMLFVLPIVCEFIFMVEFEIDVGDRGLIPLYNSRISILIDDSSLYGAYVFLLIFLFILIIVLLFIILMLRFQGYTIYGGENDLEEEIILIRLSYKSIF